MSLPDDYKNYHSYLEKKSPGFFGGWQKRFFFIVEGKLILYAESEKTKDSPKGQIPIGQITEPVKYEEDPDKAFKFTLEGRDFILRAESSELMNTWMEIIKQCRIDCGSGNKEYNFDKRRKSSVKANKMENIAKSDMSLLEKKGILPSEDKKLSEQMLVSKGINKALNLKDPKTKNRIHYGYLYKQHKTRKDYFQKRWFFIYSHRPVFDEFYSKEEFSNAKEKENFKFDFLYYFRDDKDPDEEKAAPEPIDLSKSHKIELVDKDNKFFIVLDVDDRIFELYSEVLGDRDKWFEVLKNSRRTAKEYQISILKNPRNIDLLAATFENNVDNFNKKLKKEITDLVGDTKEIKDFVVLEFSLKSLEKNILDSIDGINSTLPRKVELLMAYTDFMNTEYLDIIKNFWESQYNNLSNADILKLAMKLFDFFDDLNKVQMIDENIQKNAKEFTKVYMKKTFKNLLDVIETILKNERENKQIKNSNGKYITNGPSDLFDYLSKTFELIQTYTNYNIYEQMFNLFNESIIQYLIGVDCVTSNNKIIVAKEFLLAVANNSFTLNQRLNTLIEDTCKTNVMTEKEAYEAIRLRQINASINLMTQNSISRFVGQFSEKLGDIFKEKNFLELDIQNIMVKTRDIFVGYNEFMDKSILKKVWEEILKMSVFFYVRSLLLTGGKGLKDVHDLESKIENDSGIINETYENIVGKNLTEQNLKILKDLSDFLTLSSYMISSSCITIREYIGPSFTLNTAKTLVKFRTDFTSQDRDDAISQCKDVLEKYDFKGKAGAGGFFDRMKAEINQEEETEIEDEAEEKKACDINAEFSLEDFLKEDDDDELLENENEPEQVEIKQEEVEVVSDIKFEGYMEKKSSNKWQKRYFQLKNGYLYWYKDKNSSMIQNKLSIEKTIRVEGHKENKFLMVVDEKDSAGEGKKEDLGKIYKFKCLSEEEKKEWIKAITEEMKCFKKEQKKEQTKVSLKQKKKVIKDLSNCPDVGKDRSYMKNKTQEIMKKEKFFEVAKTPKKSKKKEEMTYESSFVTNNSNNSTPSKEDAKAKEENKIGGSLTVQRQPSQVDGEIALFEVEQVDENGGGSQKKSGGFLQCCFDCINKLTGGKNEEGTEKLNPH